MLKYFPGSMPNTTAIPQLVSVQRLPVPPSNSPPTPFNNTIDHSQPNTFQHTFSHGMPLFPLPPTASPEALATYRKKANFYFGSLIGAQDVYFKAFNSNFRSKMLGDKRSVRHYNWSDAKLENDCYSFDLGKGIMFPDAHLIEHPTLFININQTQSYSLTSMFSYGTKPTKISEIVESLTLKVGVATIDVINGTQLEFILHKYQLKWTYINELLRLPLPFDLFWGKNAFAFSQLDHHDIQFDVKINPNMIQNIKKMRLRMDHYMIDKYQPKPDAGYEYIIKQSQYKTKQITPADSKLEFEFNHPMIDLYFYFTDANNQIVTDLCFDSVKLMFNKTTHETYDADVLMSESPLPQLGIYAVNFGQNESLNFSRSEKVRLDFTNLKSISGLKIHLGGFSHNVGRQMSGMFGLAYS